MRVIANGRCECRVLSRQVPWDSGRFAAIALVRGPLSVAPRSFDAFSRASTTWPPASTFQVALVGRYGDAGEGAWLLSAERAAELYPRLGGTGTLGA